MEEQGTQGKWQLILVSSIAVAAIAGAIGGGVATVILGSTVGEHVLGPQEVLTPEAVDTKIVELIEEESATIAVVERVTPGVVSIVVKKERSSLGRGYGFRPIVSDEGAEDELVEVSSGTGFFVTEDGFLLTNRHVVDEPDATYFVVNNDGEEIPAELVGLDPVQDIAVMRAQGDTFPVVTLGDSDSIRIGQTVIAIGNTLSEFRNTVTKGVVSGINRRVTAGNAYDAEVIEQAIQTDAAINPGNSGGPLINLLGEVIGINTAVSFEGESVAFAIPINEAKRAVEDVKMYGRIVRPWLGVRYVLVAPEVGSDLSDVYEVGALIVSGTQPGESAIFDGSPADIAGLKEEDIIIGVNGELFSGMRALAEEIAQYRPEDTVELTIIRGTDIQTVSVTLAQYQEEL